MFNLNDYETVETRLEKFIRDWPDFRVSTELESMQDDRFIVKAYLYRTYLDSIPFTTGYAEEKVTDRGVNSTSALENCETSAIGRALANAGYAAKGKRPSREEMTKVKNYESKPLPNKIVATNNENVGTNVVEIVWDTTKAPDDVRELVPEPLTDLNYLTNTLNAVVVDERPNCHHGIMILKEGQGKNGAYRGYVCVEKMKANQCTARWMRLDASGKWFMPNNLAEHEG
jgi:hypothetical protein